MLQTIQVEAADVKEKKEISVNVIFDMVEVNGHIFRNAQLVF